MNDPALADHDVTSLLSSMEHRTGPLSEDRVWRVAGGWTSYMARFVLAESGPHKVAVKIGKNWDAGAYSPDTHTMYFALRNTCASQMATDDGTLYELASRRPLAPGHLDAEAGAGQVSEERVGEVPDRHGVTVQRHLAPCVLKFF